MKFLSLAMHVLSGTAQSHLSGLTVRAKFYALIGLICVLGMISGIFLLAALTIFLSREVGVIYACLIISALFAVAALVILMLHNRAQRRMKIAAMEKAALAASMEAPRSTTAIMMLEAFVNGFLNRKP